jgi:Reprolysin family propeptide
MCFQVQCSANSLSSEMTVLLNFLTFLITVNAFSLQNELHNFMDEEELKFYFGSETEVPEYEIIDLNENLDSGRESVVDEDDSSERDFNGKHVSFKVFDMQVELNLHPNKNLISPYAKIQLKTKNSTTRMFGQNDFKPPKFCHYLHKSSDSTAAISNCESKEVHGLIFLPSDTLEILPLTSKLKFLMNLRDFQFETKSGLTVTKIPHLIKRSSLKAGEFENDFRVSSFRQRKFPKETAVNSGDEQPLVELALFFDEAFYSFFAPFFKHDDEKLRNFVLAYINGVQALYHHSSLARKVDFLIVFIEFMKEQPSDLPHAYGERNALIDNFCHYQMSLNPENDINPGHWDMASI